ncbi:MAG: cell division protein ZipA [Proteobacteria bacterium]|nr:cell division protein ZipA [Pseudomonadota bacterium]
MDFDLRQWLLILGPIFIVGVLLHGYFRMRAGQNVIKMKLDRSFMSKPGEDYDSDELSMFKAELPNGGARVIDKAPGAANPDNDVPVLMESVKLPSITATSPVERGRPNVVLKARQEPTPAPASEPAINAPVDEESVDQASAKAPRARKASEVEKDKSGEETAASKHKPEKFVVIYVLALDEPFPGQGLVEILLDGGMTFGEMDIFHQLDDSGAQLFSLASAVEPGTFSMASIDQFSAPGVSLFMRVHELAEPLQVLDSMLAVADRIAQDLNGEVRDETRSVMTPQTIEYCRQSITEFLFKHSA